MSRSSVATATLPLTGIRSRQVRLAVRGFLALAVLLAVTITATSATLLFNAATALRDEAESSAIHLVELLSASFAEMGEISLANVARTLDATLDGQMAAQARIAAHLVAAAEAAGQSPDEVIATLDAITAATVLDEFWITDAQGFAYLTNVRDGSGALVPFRFDPDPSVQPQASKFYVLLAAPLDGDEFITQPAQVREIDQEVYKYVGVGGVDQPRIVQVGNALAFGEQEILTNVYATQRPDVSAVIEGILAQHMAVQATLADYLVAAAESAEWTAEEVSDRLRRIVATTAIGEIRIVDPTGAVAYTSEPSPLAGGAPSGLLHADAVEPLLAGTERIVDHPTAPRPSDEALYKYVTVAATASAPHLVQVGLPIEGGAGNLLYSVYQREADLLVQSRNLEALWVVNLDRDMAAAAPRAGQTGGGSGDAARTFDRRAAGLVERSMAEGRVVSAAQLSLLSPADRGIWVASPIINTGGIPIGGLALAVSLDEIAETVRLEAVNTTVIAFALLGLTAVAALWGTRWVTRPIEVIAAAAREVESGRPPDEVPLRAVQRRTDELGSLARVFSDMTAQVFMREEQLETLVSERTAELQTTNRSLRLAQEALEQDLEMAKSVQAALVREGNAELGPYGAYARMTPAQQVGGDFVDMLEPAGGRLFVTVGDVSGKGVAAALFMAAAQGAITSAAAGTSDVAAIAQKANRTLCSENPMGLFVTCVVAIVDLKNGVMDYVCAGHEPAFLVRADGTRRPLPATGGVAMGVIDEFPYTAGREQLGSGETLFLYTDGLTDAVNQAGELFGKERLETTLDGAAERSPEQIVDHAWTSIQAFSAGAPAADDMTCLVLRRH